MTLTKSFVIRYKKSSKKEKTKLLDEYCITSGVKRKAVIKRLTRAPVLPKLIGYMKPKKKGGRKKKYLSFHTKAIHKAWHLSGMICAERLKPVLGEFLAELVSASMITLSKDDVLMLSHIPLISLKRIVASFEEKSPGIGKRGYGNSHKGAPALYKQIPISAKFGKRTKEVSGLFEVDYVEHTGGNQSGRIAITGTYTDIVSSWTVRASGFGKSLSSITDIHNKANSRIYHKVREYHPDNAPQLLSCLFTKMQEGDNKQEIPFIVSRSRPYEKNDNAHVEQKNDDKIRKLVGYHRYDTQEEVDILNKLYEICDQIDNFFIPSSKLKKLIKNKKGKIIKRIHDTSQTPYQRLMNDKRISQPIKDRLTRLKQSLSVIELVRWKEQILNALRDYRITK